MSVEHGPSASSTPFPESPAPDATSPHAKPIAAAKQWVADHLQELSLFANIGDWVTTQSLINLAGPNAEANPAIRHVIESFSNPADGLALYKVGTMAALLGVYMLAGRFEERGSKTAEAISKSLAAGANITLWGLTAWNAGLLFLATHTDVAITVLSHLPGYPW